MDCLLRFLNMFPILFTLTAKIDKMKQYLKYIFLGVVIVLHLQVYGQQRISGFIKDASSGERLIGASIFDMETKGGTVADKTGFFSLIINSGTELRISFLGYETQQITVSFAADSIFDILLKPSRETLEGAEIKAQYRPSFNIAKMTTSEILNIPSLTGKPDVLKALQFLPGLRSQGEASSTTLVRGGSPGENLYLLDNTPLIYAHHIGGYMSVFNPEIINDVEVYKGAFPARYGERLSSIMNISQKNGDLSGFQGSFSIGLTDVALTLEGPTSLANSSFIISARKTLIDIYYAAVTGLGTDAFLWYGFHDVNGKYVWSPNQRNTFSLNFYQGDDYLQIHSKKAKSAEDGRFKKTNIWGNWLASLNWDHVLRSNMFLKNTLSFTHYRLKDVTKITYDKEKTEMDNDNLYQMMRSSLQDISWRSDASYLLKKNSELNFGLKTSYLQFKPMVFKHNTSTFPDYNEVIDALESAVYVSNKIKFFDFLDADIGLRGVHYVNNEIANFSLEPRLNVNFNLNEKHLFNLSAMRVSQNAQLISNMGSLTANEIYIPSGKGVPISYSNQFSIGYHTSFIDEKYQIELNAYHKTLSNLTTYKDGYGYTMGDVYWREKLETGGQGLAQGLEFFVKKTKGRWTGFLGYTYSTSTRQFDGINQGKTYDYEYDSPHNLSLNLACQISEKWSFSTTWQYQTGLPYTPAIGRYITLELQEDGSYLPYEVLIYGDKNSERMRAYHRLDIAFKYKKYTKRRHRRAEWTFGIYNVYNRQNPYFYYYNNSANGELYRPQYWDSFESLKLYQISMFPFMPMISYKVWFGANSGQKPKEKRSFSNWLTE